MNSATKFIGVTNALFLISSLIFTPSTIAKTAASEPTTPSTQVAPLAEPYEPGSSTVQNDWQFSPGEKTSIAANYRSHSHRSGSHCRNSHHHHSST
ncbi:MAG: hypothetical protein U0103_17765 [Candidatus Obscuribacterales bacterium]|nr:hypothetical protein [Cyanobacteria bacterium SZAS LIN-5]RTL38530.1 MAG: hypothetical protein EKK48_21745 [Candidatus Melainabacteria bacterium]